MRDDGYRSFGPGQQVEDHGNGAAAAGGIETLPRFGLADLTGASGQLWVSYVTAVRSGPIGRLMVASGSTSGSAITLARMALFTADAAGNIAKVSQTANDPTIASGTFTPYDRALATAGGWPSQYVVARGARYALGFLQVAGGAANVQGAFVLDAATPPVPTRIVGGQADIADEYAVGALTPHWAMAYMRGLPPAG